jgi:hypothetical protein
MSDVQNNPDKRYFIDALVLHALELDTQPITGESLEIPVSVQNKVLGDCGLDLRQAIQLLQVLSLMNGMGLAKNLENLPAFLQKVHDLLLPGGRFIADSTDVKYLYEDEDGGYWLDLNSAYYGNFKFQMHYKKFPKFPPRSI